MKLNLDKVIKEIKRFVSNLYKFLLVKTVGSFGKIFPNFVLKIIPNQIQEKYMPFKKGNKTILRLLIMSAKSSIQAGKTEYERGGGKGKLYGSQTMD